MTTDNVGADATHYLGAAGEFLVAYHFINQGCAVYFPVAQAHWVDLIVQTKENGFKRVQVKTTGEDTLPVRARSLGSNPPVEPEDRYDLLAVVRKPHLWIIPSTVLRGRDSITLHPETPHKCAYGAYLERY
jgi:hypothetical protein